MSDKSLMFFDALFEEITSDKVLRVKQKIQFQDTKYEIDESISLTDLPKNPSDFHYEGTYTDDKYFQVMKIIPFRNFD